MGHSGPEMLSTEDHFGELFILRNTFINCHSHLPKHQSDQSSSARSGHKLEDVVWMQLAESCAEAGKALVDLIH